MDQSQIKDKLPLIIGAGCALLFFLGAAFLVIVGLIIYFGARQNPQSNSAPSVKPDNMNVRGRENPVNPPFSDRSTPSKTPRTTQPQFSDTQQSYDFTLVKTGGYDCDLNTNNCKPSTSSEMISVRNLGNGIIQIQTSGGISVEVDQNCTLVNQKGYTLFPCPFNPNVQSFQGAMITPQGIQPIYSSFQYALIDEDYDQDGIVNEPGYYSYSTGSFSFEAYRENGTLKFAGYLVDAEQYRYLYVFTYDKR